MLTIKPTEQLQAKRVKAGLSIRCLAKKAGVNPATVYKLENRLTSPNPATAAKVCSALGVDFDEVFEIASAGTGR